MTHEEPRPKWLPRLVPFFPSSQHAEGKVHQNIFMFAQDFSHVMPTGSRRKKRLSVELSGDDDSQRRALEILDALSERAGHSSEEKLSNAVDTVAGRIVCEGRAQFELVPRDDGTTQFHAITTKNMFRLFGYGFQYLCPQDREFWKSSAVRNVPLSALWHIDVPRELGGRRGHRRMLSALKTFDNLGPRFWSHDIERGENPSHFDLGTYVRSHKIFQYKAAHLWGWNCRDWSSDRTTEFYNMYLSAASERAKCVLRSHIISAINALLVCMNINCSITVRGLATAAEVQQLMRELVTGELSFKQFADFKYTG